MRQFSLWLIALTLLGACESEIAPETERLGTQYYPLSVGQYRIYDVEETRYYLIGPETENYQLMEEVVDSVVLSGDVVMYNLHRSTRMDENSEWKLDSIWNTTVSLKTIVANENNVSLVKMVFPIEEGLEWDTNIFNSRSAEYYRYNESRLDTTLAEQEYMQAIKVIQSDDGFDSVGRDDRLEIYAPHVGLIYKEMYVWSYFQENGEVDPSKIVAGRDLKQVLIENGERD